MVEEKTAPLLHKCKEPYRPPHHFKSDWTDYKDEVWVSLESLGKKEGCKQNWRRDFLEVTWEGHKEAFQENKNKISSEQRSKNAESILPLELSKNDEIIDSLVAEHSDSSAKHPKSPATCSAFANQSLAIEQKPAYGMSCTEGSKLIAHGFSTDHSTKVRDNHLKFATEETSQLYGCKIPAVILGVLPCVGLEHIFELETKEFSCSVLWDGCDAEYGKQESGNHHGSHHLMLLSVEGTEQKDMTAASELTDHNKLKFLSKGYAGECEKDLTREPSFGTSSTKGLQWTSACTCNRLSSVGRSTRKSVSQTCKFFPIPIANNNHLASATHRYRPSVINSEAIVFSSTTDLSKGRENQSVSDELKPVKADRVSPGAPVDSSRKPMDTKAGVTDEKSTHVTSVPPVYKGKMSYRASPALINCQVKAVNPKFKPQNPSNQAFSANVFPQQMVTTTCMQELYHVQAFPWNYHLSGYGCVPLPT